jgi:oxygen-independent coproporphyrinogen-3 oxidase
LHELKALGFNFNSSTEVTIEINPATVSEKKLELYLKNGINRFSVGAQTFNDRLLKSVNREHSANDTRNTLNLLEKYKLNYSFDILFALPNQTIDELKEDLKELSQFQPKHISPYCLTVPESHPLAKNRAPDEEQIEMFELIHEALEAHQFSQYEISNYAKNSFESKHNLLYWQDEPYLGIGLSAHSYLKNNWGHRFWNSSNIKTYIDYYKEHHGPIDLSSIDQTQIEHLTRAQSLTDFCHTSLRLNAGLNMQKVEEKFGLKISDLLTKKFSNPRLDGLIEARTDSKANIYRLSRQGQFISNSIFEFFTFFDHELSDL